MSGPNFLAQTGGATNGMPLSVVLNYPGLSALNPNHGGVDWSKQYLTYLDSAGVEQTPKNAAELRYAVYNLKNSYPQLFTRLLNIFGADPLHVGSYKGSPNSQDSQAWDSAWKAFAGNKYTVIDMPNPYAAQATQSIAYWENLANNQKALGVADATETQQVNAMDNAYNTIDTWAGLNQTQKSFLNDVIARVVATAGNHVVNPNALMDILRGDVQPLGFSDADVKKIRADYDAAFPGLRQYNSSGNVVKMTEANYMTYTASIINASTQYGAPQPDKNQIGVLLNHHVSPIEYQQRLTDVYAAITNSDQTVRNTLQQQYGVNTNDLMSYMINGNLPSMQRQVASAQIQEYAGQVGLPQLTQQEAEDLAERAKLTSVAGNQILGYGTSAIKSDLLTASRDVALTQSAPGQSQPTVTTSQLIGSQVAGFGGTNQVAEQAQVARAEQSRAGIFEKGGGFAETAKGVIGLGGART